MTFALSSGAIGFSPNDTWLVAGRAIQGIGAAFMMPATLSIITNAFPPHERGKAIGTWAGVSAMALAIGPVVGGFLVQSVSWQSIFFLNLPVAAGAVAVTLFATHESRDETVARVVDIPGVAAITVGLAALVIALVEGNSWHWGSVRVIGLLVLAVISLVSFVVIEQRVQAPMVDFSFFRSRSFLGANIVAFIVSFAMLAMFFFLALYMQNIKGYSPLQAGVRFLPSTALIIVIGPIAGRLTDRIGPRVLMTGGLLAVAGSLFWQSFLHVNTSYGFLVGAFVLMGVGMGFVMSPMSTAAMNAVDATKAGVASGVLSDEPHGRRHLRRRRAGRADHGARPLAPGHAAPPFVVGGARSPGRLAGHRRGRPGAPPGSPGRRVSRRVRVCDDQRSAHRSGRGRPRRHPCVDADRARSGARARRRPGSNRVL